MLRGDPLSAEELLRDEEVLLRLLGVAHAAGSLEADVLALLLDDGHHDAGGFGSGVHFHLAGRGLDEVGAVVDGDLARLADQSGLLQLPGLDDDLQRNLAARLLAALDELSTDLLVAGDQRLVWEDNIDFVSTIDDSGSIGVDGGVICKQVEHIQKDSGINDN